LETTSKSSPRTHIVAAPAASKIGRSSGSASPSTKVLLGLTMPAFSLAMASRHPSVPSVWSAATLVSTATSASTMFVQS
jgi:hypothetical protein